MEYAVEASNPKVQKFLNAIMPSIIEQVGLTNSRKAVLVKVTKDDEEQGSTHALDFIDSYLITIKPPTRLTMKSLCDVTVTLSHEMVHVRQYAKGILKNGENGGKYWMGRYFSKKTRYTDMPWEIDAFSKQEIIARRAIEE